MSFPVRKGILRRVVDHNPVVKNISFTLRPGETLGLVGESGSGKAPPALPCCVWSPHAVPSSSTANHCTSGTASRCCRYGTGFRWCFQDPNSALNPRLNVQQIIEEGLRVHQPELTRSAREQRVIEVMQEVGLDPGNPASFPPASSREVSASALPLPAP